MTGNWQIAQAAGQPSGTIASLGLLLGLILAVATGADQATGQDPTSLIGYTELRTNLAGGRHANTRTVVVKTDGSGRRMLVDELADRPDSWTQFAGWSPMTKMAHRFGGPRNGTEKRRP